MTESGGSSYSFKVSPDTKSVDTLILDFPGFWNSLIRCGIILQYIHISNHYVTHLKLYMLHVSYISITPVYMFKQGS